MGSLLRLYGRYVPRRFKVLVFWLRQAEKRWLSSEQLPGVDNSSLSVPLGQERYFSKTKDGDEIVSDWRAVLDISSKLFPSAFYARVSRALRKQGNFDAAEAVIRHGISFYPEEHRLNQGLAQLAMVNQDWSVVVEQWQKILGELKEDSPPLAYRQMSRAFIKLGDLDAAHSIVSKGALAFPDDFAIVKVFGTIDRMRIFRLFMDRFVNLKRGMRILHLAPEAHLFYRLAQVVGDGYDPRDLDPERYKSLRYGNIRVRNLDLCSDAHSLPKNHYDLILHNHVMEHVQCNYTAVLCHLHHSLAENGLHMFTIPMLNGSYEEDWTELPSDERRKRFYHIGHIRNFTRNDIEKTIGMIFDIEDQLKTNTLEKLFDDDLLDKNDIQQFRRKKFNDCTPFILKKGDLKI